MSIVDTETLEYQDVDLIASKSFLLTLRPISADQCGCEQSQD